MCGIMGYVGHRPVVDVLIKGLKRLEYRGYDSAGIAVFENGGVEIAKTEGKINRLEGLLKERGPMSSNCGIGHTRWATHGKPTTQNAHPHKTGHVILVHNGIIENYLSIKKELAKRGHRPVSETDSELFGFLVLEEMEKGSSLATAVRTSFLRLDGACSVVVMSEREPGVIVGIRNGSPLVATVDPKGGVIFASDAQPLLDYTQDVVFLNNGDMVVGTKAGLSFVDFKTGKPVDRLSTKLDWSAEKLDKRGFSHYMLKEIYEQPQTMIDTLNSVLDRAHTDPFPLAAQEGVSILQNARELALIAAGTSWHAAFLGKYWLERWAGRAVSVELSSEFRYRDPIIGRDTAVIGISQSGETADTLAVVNEMRRRGIPTIALTNVRGSTISRDAHATFYTSAGPEIGVAATKTFTSQMLMLFLWAGFLGLRRGKDTSDRVPRLFDSLLRIPHLLEAALQPEHEMIHAVQSVANNVQHKKGFFFIGRGYSYPLALEGALKLKEIAYIHAEGYAAGELKHGPIALIDKDMVLVVIAPKDSVRDKTLSNLQEVKARGATILGIGCPDDRELREQCHEWIPIPVPPKFGVEFDESLFPFMISPIIQLLAYRIAALKGTEIDQPRNLAKSVTVE